MNRDVAPVHVVVVELHHHGELIRNLIKVLGLGHFRMTLVTVPSVLEAVGHDWEQTIDWLSYHVQKPEEPVADFIQRMAPVFDLADVLYFNTVRHNWAELASILKRCPSVLRIHNAHADLAPASHFYRPLKNSLAIASHLIRKVLIGGEWRQREAFLGSIDYVMFPNEAISRYVLSQGWLAPEKVLSPVVPFAFLGDLPGSSKIDTDDLAGSVSRPVTVAITGKVTEAKKEYALVFRAFERCLDRLNHPVKLKLLGKAAGRKSARILSAFQSLQSDRFTLEYSEGYVSAEDFDREVSEVDFLLAPIKVETHFRKYMEIYGKSKMSGIENDILLYQKPSLVTSRYQIKGVIDQVVGYFEPTPEGLATKLEEWINRGRFRELRPGFQKMEVYRPEVVAKEFYTLCQSLLEVNSISREN